MTITSAEPIEDSGFVAAVDEAGFDVVGVPYCSGSATVARQLDGEGVLGAAPTPR